ncbi:Putative conserved secreted protein, partial [Gryllus bimaculatus]
MLDHQLPTGSSAIAIWTLRIAQSTPPTRPTGLPTDNFVLRPNRWPDSGGGGGGGGGGNGGYRPWEHKKPHYDYSHGGGGGGGGLRPSGGGGGYDSHRHPPSHPDESEGQWVLVSSTKGFAVPHRHRIFQRALAISAKPLTSRRTVESTFQSVEEEQQQQELQHHLQHHRPAAPHYVPVHAPSYRPVQHQPPPPPPSLRPTHNDVTPLVE